MKEAVTVLENGNKVLKQLQEEVNIDKWEKIGDDLNDLRDNQAEIGNFLKNHNKNISQFENEVDEELEKLMKLEKIQKLKNKLEKRVTKGKERKKRKELDLLELERIGGLNL